MSHEYYLICYGGPLHGLEIGAGDGTEDFMFVKETIYNVRDDSTNVVTHKYRKGTNDYDIEGWIHEGAIK